MNSLLFSGIFVLAILGSSISSSVPATPTPPPTSPVLATSTPEWIKSRIKHYASYYDVSAITMENIVKCESGFNPKAINSTALEYSVGLVQINLRAHYKNGITKEMALDPEFSLDFLARKLKEGSGGIWTCWKYR